MMQNLNWNCKRSYVSHQSLRLHSWSQASSVCIALVHIASAQDHIFLTPNAVVMWRVHCTGSRCQCTRPHFSHTKCSGAHMKSPWAHVLLHAFRTCSRLSVSKLFNRAMVLTLPLFGRLCSSQTLSPPSPHQPESEPKHPHFHTNRHSPTTREQNLETSHFDFPVEKEASVFTRFQLHTSEWSKRKSGV